MPKFPQKIILLAVLITLSFSQPVLADSANLTQSIADKVLELKKINEQIRQNQQEIEKTQNQQKTLKNELKKIGTNINQVNLTIQAGEVKVQTLTLQLVDLNAQIKDLQQNIGINRQAISKLIQALSEFEQQTPLEVFLKNNSLTQAFSELESVSKINGQLLTSVGTMKNLNAQLSDQFNLQINKKKDLETENEKNKDRQKILANQQSDRVNLLAQTKSQEKIFQQQLSALEQKQSEINDEISKVEAELRKNVDPSVLPIRRPGVLAFPVADARITQGYGNTTFAQRAYRTQFHNGVDFGVSIGTEVLSAGDGKIIEIGNNGKYQYGKHIVIEHGNNLTTLYAHLSAFVGIKIGDNVTKGQLIGYSGNTGYTFGPHLHFGVYWSPSVRLESLSYCNCGTVPLGVTINPLDYLP